jgi:hypothetical protein
MYKILPIVNLIFFLDNFRFATISVIVIVLIVINNKMLYFALRAFGFLITKHKHKNNNLLFSLTPLVLYSFSPLPYSFIHLPAVFAPYFSPFPSLSLYHFAACVRSSHYPRVTSCTFSLSSPSFPFLSLSPRPHLCNPLTHTLSPPYCTSILLFSLFSLTFLCLCLCTFLFTFSLHIFSPSRLLILSFF